MTVIKDSKIRIICLSAMYKERMNTYNHAVHGKINGNSDQAFLQE